MAKRVLSAQESFDLRQALQLAALDALMASRRWQPGELVFQGGTSLNLAHGSPRFSEDLDFLVDSTIDLGSIGERIAARLEALPWLPRGTKLSVSKAKDAHNPHAFDIVIGGPSVIGSARVKVELWQGPKAAMDALQVLVKPVRLASGPSAGIQAFVPTASASEIYVDKIFALAARPYLKPRDVFDLHWLRTQEAGPSGLTCSVDALGVRLLTYPNESASGWIEKARQRLDGLALHKESIARDLAKWLPSSWPITPALVDEMVSASAASLEEGIEQMSSLVDDDQASAPKHPVQR